MNGMITCAEHFSIEDCLGKIRAHSPKADVAQVTRAGAEVIAPTVPVEGAPLRVAVLDYGVRNSIIASLTGRGCEVTVLPAATSAQTVLAGGYDGVLLSNGPGDPAENTAAIDTVKALYESTLPIFALCLGHQLLALATGAQTRRMRFGHRGCNHPVRDVQSGRAIITSQNHGYVVCKDSLDPAVAEVSHVNVNEGSVEGLIYKRPNCFSVQFHPEAAPGPKDTRYLFDRFVEMMKGGRR